MTQAGTVPAATRPLDPVWSALNDPELQTRLLQQAVARLNFWLADRRGSILDEAGEAVQEACTRAMERATEYDPARCEPGGWLHGILNLVLHERCRSLRNAPLQPAASPAEWESLAAPSSHADDPSPLSWFLEALSEDDGRIIKLHHLEGLSHVEIATKLGISIGASRTRLARAMAELKRLAAKEGGR